MAIVDRFGLENQPRWYEAHQYRLENVHEGHERCGKQYVGVKKDYADTGYVHSADTNIELKEDLAVCDFVQTFENFGTWSAMREIETTELRKANTVCPLKENPDYYNNHVGSTSITHVDYEAVKYLYERIATGEFNSAEKELVLVLDKIHALQVRVQDNGDLAKQIADTLKSNGLDTRDCDPILIYEGIGVNNSEVIGDGNTTLDGCVRANAQHIATIRIPKEEVMGWGEGEYRALSNLMNKRPVKEMRPVTKEDAIKYVVDLYRAGNVWDCPETRNYLIYELNFNRNPVDTIMKEAKHQIECVEAEKTSSVVWMDMAPSGKYRDEIVKKQMELNPQNPDNVKAFSSAKFNWETWIDTLWSITVPDPDSIMKHGHPDGRCPPYRDEAFLELTDDNRYLWENVDIIVYHSKREYKEQWDRDIKDSIEGKLNWLVRHALPDATITVHEMEMERENVLDIDKVA